MTPDKYEGLVTADSKLGRKVQMTVFTMPSPLNSLCPKDYWTYVFHGNCIDYITTGDYTNLKRLLQKFPEFVNDCGFCRKSPLSTCSYSMYENNLHNNSPLGFVVMKNDDTSHIGTLLFDYLAVEKRANLYHVNDRGVNLLELAVSYKKVKYLDSLLKLDSKISSETRRQSQKAHDHQFMFTINSPIHDTDDYGTLKYVVENWDRLDFKMEGVTNVKTFINYKYKEDNDYSLLHSAVKRCQLDCAKYLLENGADVGSCTENGNTPMHIAAEDENIVAVKLLLRYKADPKAVNNSGYDVYKKASNASREFGCMFADAVDNNVEGTDDIDIQWVHG